jgi:hypothetical protein
MWLDHSIAFASIGEITELGFDQNQSNPSLTLDDLTMYFGRHNATTGFIDTFVTTRSARGATWRSPQPVGSLNGAFDNGRIAISADGATAIASTSRGGTAALWQWTRSGNNFSAGTQVPLAQVNVFDRELDPELVLDGTLYFAPINPDNSQQIMTTTRATTGNFGAPIEITQLEPTNSTGDITLSPDELVAVISSSSNPTDPNNDLYFATRSSTSSAFGGLFEVPGVNAASNDGDGALSHDGCELFFRTDRQGRDKLYVARVQ